MPIPSTAKWPKPKSAEEFEDIAVDFLRIRWKDPHATRHGRSGQRQNGVDVTGRPPWLKGRTAGAQCKNTDSLTLAIVIAEVEEAKIFPGGLGEYLMLTTGDRDASLQAEVREHFKSKPAPFHVGVVFWPDITADVSQDDVLVAKHWKGFGEASTVTDGWPNPPTRIDRDQVREEEIVECQCELALRTPTFADVGASELAAEVQAFSREKGSSAGIEIAMMMAKPATRVLGRFLWREHHRECTNVVRKWELEIGAGSYLAFRWSKFTNEANHRQPMLEMLSFIDGVVVPIRVHRVATERAAKRVGVALPPRLAARLTCYANGKLLLHDDIRATLPLPRYSMAESSSTWTEDIDAKWEPSSRSLAIRLLNRALANFVAPGPAIDGTPGSFVTVNEETVTRVGGDDL